MLRSHQSQAIQCSIDNEFASGIHHHATGTGKSYVALELAIRFHNAFPSANVLWLCEQKSILREQFSRSALSERGYSQLQDSYLVTNIADTHIYKWWEKVNQSTIWGKPILLIANRPYITYNSSFKKLGIKFDLVIHDECHSIINTSTQLLYKHLSSANEKCNFIGLSATPNYENPWINKCLSTYSLYDAVRDNIVVPPVIRWITCDSKLNDVEVIRCFKKELLELPRSKIIIWCGTINGCIRLSQIWSTAFPDHMIAIDTSATIEGSNATYSDFRERERNAIMFCAGKHREGSDIPGLDCCIFLDGVGIRSSRLFLQSAGRVVRHDPLYDKSRGLVIDVRAKSSIELCDRMNQYLALKPGMFPWDYQFTHCKIGGKMIKQNTLTLDVTRDKRSATDSVDNTLYTRSVSKEQLRSHFVRSIPQVDDYTIRLEEELELIFSKKLENNLMLALDILNITKNIPHVTRGSCGSSLVCYLLGISHVDPIINDISFARFLNEFRDNLPDIDFDFPHFLRDEVFLRMQMKWPGLVARISNHVYYHEKSAIRQSLRDNGITGFIAKEDINRVIYSLSPEKRTKILSDSKKLENTFRNYSLHCGGVVFFPEGIPDHLILNREGKSMAQLTMNKEDVANEKSFKIDILSSRALSQLTSIMRGREINFYANDGDQQTSNMLTRGLNLGITLAESPLMRKALMCIKPKGIDDIAICLAIIRPAAKEAKNVLSISPDMDVKEQIVFDDDAIQYFVKTIGCSEAEGDYYRRGFAKRKEKVMSQFIDKISEIITDDEQRKSILDQLSGLSRYGFCKAHAYSYAQLVWQLSYQKSHNPIKFWKAALSNCDSFYRRWVHLYEASRVGICVDKLRDQRHKSLYAELRTKNIDHLSYKDQLRKQGYWNMSNGEFVEDCFYRESADGSCDFCGIIASSRILGTCSKTHKPNCGVVFLGVGDGKYIEVLLKRTFPSLGKKIGISGSGKLPKEEWGSIETYKFKCF